MGRAAQPRGSRAVRRVIVIGGGLAGIAAGLDCAAADAQVTLVEVRPRLGGAAYSFEREGLWLDNGQHVFLRCCEAYRSLLERLGSAGQTVLQDRLELPVLAPGRPAAWLRRSGLPAPLHLAGSLLRYRHLTPPQRIAVVRAAAALGRIDPEDPDADERSFGEWLAERGQGPDAVEAVWELIGRPTLNLSARDASLAAAAFVFRVGLLERTDAGDIGYARAPLQRVHGDAALGALGAAGVDVRLGWRATAIEHHDGRFMVAGPSERLDADAVVLAVPHERAARLLPSGAVRDAGALERLGSSPIVNLHLCYDRRVFEHEFAAVVSSPVQYVFDRTGSSGLEHGQCLAVSLSAADEEADMPADQLQARFQEALAELLPAARGARLERFVVTREHTATFRAAPGARRLRPGARTAIAGLALAGAWTNTGWPATMEGAVRSGHAAATVALESLGARPPSERAEALV
jgi:squalene-associated FAD-dependent desaturase